MCVCVWGGGGGVGSCLETGKYQCIAFIASSRTTPSKPAVELVAACSLLREWSGAWDTFFFVDNHAFKK